MFLPGYLSPLHFLHPPLSCTAVRMKCHVYHCVCVCVCARARACVCVCVCRSVVSDSLRLPFPSPEELPNPGIELWFPAWQAGSLPFVLQGSLSVDFMHHSRSFHLRVVGLLWLSSSTVYLRGTRWITLPF